MEMNYTYNTIAAFNTVVKRFIVKVLAVRMLAYPREPHI
jgi:hypothetical protein